MHCTIKNTAGRPVLLRLNSGQTLHLNGNEELAGVLVVEIKDNERIQRLIAKGAIRISDPDGPKTGSPSRVAKVGSGSGQKKNS